MNPQWRAQLLIRLLVHQALNETEPHEDWDDEVSPASWEIKPQLSNRWHMLVHQLSEPLWVCEGIRCSALQVHWHPIILLTQLLFLWNLFSKCLCEVVLMILWAIWWRASRFWNTLAQLLPTNHNYWMPKIGNHQARNSDIVFFILVFKKHIKLDFVMPF